MMEGENVLEYGKKMQQALPADIKVAVLHGRMKPEEKQQIMDAFASGETAESQSTSQGQCANTLEQVHNHQIPFKKVKSLHE